MRRSRIAIGHLFQIFMKYYEHRCFMPCVHARALRGRASDKYIDVPAVVYRSNPSSKFHVAGKLDGASKGRTARYNLHSNSRASRTMMTDRGRGNPFGRRGGLCFRTERSLAEHGASRSATPRIGRYDDRDSLRHANSVGELRNNDPRSPVAAEVARATFIAGRTSRNYPPAKYAALL